MTGTLAEPVAHGYCLLWNPRVLWTLVISDAAIAIAYFSIPLVLMILLDKRKNTPFTPVIALFAAFIVLCGTTHVLDIVSIWRPIYDLIGVMKALTAVVSIATAIAFATVVPRMIRVPDPYADESTSLPNRALLVDRIEQASMRTKRTSRPFAVVFVRCSFAYPLEPLAAAKLRPAILSRIGEELRGCVRSVDTVALGEGNEFVVLAEGIDDASALDVVLARIVDVMARPMRFDRDRIAIESRIRTVVSDGTIAAHALLAEPTTETETERAFSNAAR